MKTRSLLSTLLLIGSCFLLIGEASAQSKKTIILVRHTEKSMAVANDPDPDLSAEGRERAIKLMNLAKRYRPNEIFSTNYKRTRQSVEPIATRRKKEIQIYDPARQADLVAKIMASRTKTNLIVGHSNTIPALANLFAKKEVFRNLLETEYGVVWVIRMKKGLFTKIEVLPY